MTDDRKDYRSLGEILRDAREAKSQSVEDLAQITKISPKAIVAIEADDMEQLAGPIYAKSFVRTLAEAFKLDVEFMLTKLEHATAALEGPEEGGPRDDDSTWHLENVRVRKVEEPPSRRWMVVVAAVVVLGVLGIAVRSMIGGAEAPQPVDTTTQAPLRANPDPGPPPGLAEGSRVRSPDTEAGSDAIGEPEPEAVAVAPAESRPLTQSTQAPPGNRNTGLTARAEPRDPSSVDDAASPPPAEARPVPADPVVEDDGDPGPTTEADPDPADDGARSPRGDGLPSIMRPSGGDRTEMTLEIEARGRVDVWVGSDGETRQRYSLTSGSSVKVTARDHFSLLLSDPRAVRVTMDGIPRTPPPGLRGEWILYPERR